MNAAKCSSDITFSYTAFGLPTPLPPDTGGNHPLNSTGTGLAQTIYINGAAEQDQDLRRHLLRLKYAHTTLTITY